MQMHPTSMYRHGLPHGSNTYGVKTDLHFVLMTRKCRTTIASARLRFMLLNTPLDHTIARRRTSYTNRTHLPYAQERDDRLLDDRLIPDLVSGSHSRPRCCLCFDRARSTYVLSWSLTLFEYVYLYDRIWCPYSHHVLPRLGALSKPTATTTPPRISPAVQTR